MRNNSEPWESPWRKEVQRLLSEVSSSRRPALRRSRRADYLFATDLPCCAGEEDCQRFQRLAAEAGWETQPESGWIQLRKPAAPLPPGFLPGDPGEEWGCVLSLMRRHPGQEDAAGVRIALMKAREDGSAAWQRACRAFHRDLARRLRQGESFPSLPELDEAGGITEC